MMGTLARGRFSTQAALTTARLSDKLLDALFPSLAAGACCVDEGTVCRCNDIITSSCPVPPGYPPEGPWQEVLLDCACNCGTQPSGINCNCWQDLHG